MQLEREFFQLMYHGKSAQFICHEHTCDAFLTLRYDDYEVLITCVVDFRNASPRSFIPLSLNYQEKSYASGRIPGGFGKREGKASDHEILIGRLIDRILRANIQNHFDRDIDLNILLLSQPYNTHHKEPFSLIPLMVIGAHIALHLAKVPQYSVLGCVEENWYFEKKPYNFLVAASSDSLLTVEGCLPDWSEETVFQKIQEKHQIIREQISLIQKTLKKILTLCEPEDTLSIPPNHARWLSNKLGGVKWKKRPLNLKERRIFDHELLKEMQNDLGDSPTEIQKSFMLFLREKTIQSLKKSKSQRLDKRGCKDIRPIHITLNPLKTAQGSALFQRGMTHVLGVTTLGIEEDRLITDAPAQMRTHKTFFLHYNMPSFAVGEISYKSSPSRREIGHGTLAEKAFKAVLPHDSLFPFTIRVVAEVLSSDGSSSMASVCAASLSLTQAGVPLKKLVAGVSLGLLQASSETYILSDIQAEEDFIGDMDLKIAGTHDGITAIHLDLKKPVFRFDQLRQALNQAREGRLHILTQMQNVLEKDTSKGLYVNLPMNEFFLKNSKKFKRLNRLFPIHMFETPKQLSIWSPDSQTLNEITTLIHFIAMPPEIHERYRCMVEQSNAFGIRFKIKPGWEAFLHVSQLSREYKEGEWVYVKVTGFNHQGKVRVEEIEEDPSINTPKIQDWMN